MTTSLSASLAGVFKLPTLLHEVQLKLPLLVATKTKKIKIILKINKTTKKYLTTIMKIKPQNNFNFCQPFLFPFGCCNRQQQQQTTTFAIHTLRNVFGGCIFKPFLLLYSIHCLSASLSVPQLTACHFDICNSKTLKNLCFKTMGWVLLSIRLDYK